MIGKGITGLSLTFPTTTPPLKYNIKKRSGKSTMNQFNEQELKEYDKLEKKILISKAEKAEKTIKELTYILFKIQKTQDLTIILDKGSEIYFKLCNIRPVYFDIISILQKINPAEGNFRLKTTDDYKQMYWLIKDFSAEEYETLINNKTFKPEKGTYQYSKCKGYYSVSRIDMGKMIKKDLQEHFNDWDFSVTTEKGLWKDIVNVGFKLPEKGDYKEMREELILFLMEYEPRVDVRVFYKNT